MYVAAVSVAENAAAAGGSAVPLPASLLLAVPGTEMISSQSEETEAAEPLEVGSI